jgi:hypothetical protein
MIRSMRDMIDSVEIKDDKTFIIDSKEYSIDERTLSKLVNLDLVWDKEEIDNVRDARIEELVTIGLNYEANEGNAYAISFIYTMYEFSLKTEDIEPINLKGRIHMSFYLLAVHPNITLEMVTRDIKEERDIQALSLNDNLPDDVKLWIQLR